MKSRQEIKALAKEAMAQQRGTCILILLLVGLAGGVGGLFSLVPIIGWLATIAVEFVLIVLVVNGGGAFIRIFKREPVEVTDPFKEIQVNFFRKVGGMFWMMLWIWIWSLLLIIPGIIKCLAYSMTPYILADCPNVPAKEALKLSMRMTDGHKGKLFVLGLSWIGWVLLSGLTFGILALVFTGPYMATTHAGFYIELRDQAIASGKIQASELA